jgi:ADP-ribose pyrophosphatase
MSDTETPDFSETTIASEKVFDGVLLHVRKDIVRLPNGHIATREYIEHQGAAMVLAFVDERTLLLERQFRYPLRRHFIELPAGKIDRGEEPLNTAQRELREECGYEAAFWRHLGTLHPCIGYADERIELYLARDLTHVGDALDEDEFLQVFHVSIDEALEWIRTGRITEPKAITGLLWADKIARGEWTVD